MTDMVFLQASCLADRFTKRLYLYHFFGLIALRGAMMKGRKQGVGVRDERKKERGQAQWS